MRLYRAKRETAAAIAAVLAIRSKPSPKGVRTAIGRTITCAAVAGTAIAWLDEVGITADAILARYAGHKRLSVR